MDAPFDHGGTPLQTPRLILRPWTMEDLDALFALTSNPRVSLKAGFRPHESKERTEASLVRLVNGHKDYAIVLRETGTIVGSIGLEPVTPEEELPEFDPYLGRAVGYMLNEDYWGRGLATEAVRKVVEYAFDTLGFDFLLCGHLKGNPASARVQRKCGFKPFRQVEIATGLRIVYQTETLYYQTNPNKDIPLNFPALEI